MKTQSTEPAFSTLSMVLLLIAVACALVSIVRGYASIWPIAEWVGGISALALIASLVNDARK
jgi:hypothetical protein